MFVIHIDEIRQNYLNGKYSAKSPQAAEKAKLPESYVFDENLSVKRNREMVLEHNRRADELVAAYRAEQLELDKRLHESVIAYIKYNYNLSDKQARMVESFVYREHHSFMCDYFSYIDTYADFADNLVNIVEE